MPKILHYEDNEVKGFPHRLDLLNKDDFVDPDNEDWVLFHGLDIKNIPKYSIFNHRLDGYSVIIAGILKSGERAHLIIDKIPIYFDVKLSLKNNSKLNPKS